MQFRLNKDKKMLPKIVDYLKSLTIDQIVEVRDPNRSRDQNALFWTNVEILANHTGYTKDEMNAIIKKDITQKGLLTMMHTKWTPKLQVEVYKSTTELTTKEWWILMDYVYKLGQTLDLQMKYADDWLLEHAKQVFN